MSRRSLLTAVAFAAVGASVAVVPGPALAVADIGDVMLRDVGAGLTLVDDDADSSGTLTRTWRGDAGELTITGFSVTTPPGVRPLFDGLLRADLGLDVVAEPSLGLGAWLVDPGGAPGEDGVAAMIVASRDHLFEMHMTAPAASAADLSAFVLDVAHRQVDAAGGPPADAAPRDVDDEALLAFLPDAPPPGYGLGSESVTVTGENELENEGIASETVVDFVNDRSANAARAWTGDDLSVAIGVTRYPYDVFAAASLGDLADRDAATTQAPAALEPADAVVLRDDAARQASVVFRRGDLLVIVLVDHRGAATGDVAQALAIDAANLVHDRLPTAGGTEPYEFPSAPSRVVGLALTAGFVTAAVAGSRGIARLHARHVTRRWAVEADTDEAGLETALPAPGTGAIVHLDDDAAALRRRGRVVVGVQLLGANVVVLAVSSEFAWPPRFVIAAAAMLSTLAFGRRWLRREHALLGPTAPPRGFVVPRVSGVLMWLIALAVLAIGVAYLARGLRWIVLSPTLAQLRWTDVFGVAPRTVGVIFAVGGAVVTAIGAVLFRIARALASVRVRETLRADPRPAVLYLRSFGDDKVSLPVIASARRPLFELFSIRGADPFEEAVAWELRSYGPVVSVGRPGGTLASLGAAREHLPQETWRDQIADRMRGAGMIVLAPGETAGVAWELGEIVGGGHLVKTVFVFPPLPPSELARRWRHTTDVLHRSGAPVGGLPARAAATHTVRVDPSGDLHTTVASKRDEATYRVAVDRAFEVLPRAPASTPVGTNR